MGFKYRINYKMISGEGLDMNCFDEILTASLIKDSPLQLWNITIKKWYKMEF